jgi:predicted dehydrogenase
VGVAWGLLSTATINDLVLAAVRGSDRVDVVAVASRDRRRAEAYARERGIERAHGSYEALLADPGVEAVYVSLPNSMHVDWSIRALEAGKHVLVEKPLSRRPEDVARAFDAAERAGRLLSEAFMWRHHPQTARLAELVRDGAVGELQLVRCCFSFPLLATRWPSDVRLNPLLDGGALMDVGCYCVSGARLLAGEPLVVHAEQVMGPSGVDVRLAATMRHPGDVVDDPWHAVRPGIELRRDDTVERIEVPEGDAYRFEFENVSDAIRDVAPLRLGREDATGQARAIAALYRSAETGAPVSPLNAG